MGGNTSKTKTSSTVVNEMIIESITNNISNCTAQGTQSQSMINDCSHITEKTRLAYATSLACAQATTTGDPKIVALACNGCVMMGNNQVMKATITADCSQVNEVARDIQADLINKMKQKAEEAKTGGIGDDSETESSVDVENKIKLAFTTNNISNSLASLDQVQVMTNTAGVMLGNSQKMVGEVILKSLQENSEVSEAIAAMESVVEQTTKKESTGTLSAVAKVMGDTISSVVDTIGDTVGDLMGGMVIFYIVGVIFALVVMFMFKDTLKCLPPWGLIMCSSGDSSGDKQPQQQQQNLPQQQYRPQQQYLQQRSPIDMGRYARQMPQQGPVFPNNNQPQYRQ